MQRTSKKIYWPKSLILELIEEFRKHEYLYNLEHNFYHNKRIRNEGYESILNNLKQYNPRFTGNVDDVKIKWNILRTQYSSEMRKIVAAAKNGIHFYQPTLYFFSQIDFMRKHTVPGTIDLGGLRIVTLEEECQADRNSSERTESEYDDHSEDDCGSKSADDEINDKLSIANVVLQKAVSIFRTTDSDNCTNNGATSPPRKKARVDNESVALKDESNNALRAASHTLQIISNNLEQNAIDISFAKYIKEEMMMIKSNLIRSDMRDRIISVIFDYKRKETK